MCGNGARCFAKFVKHLEGDTLDTLTFETRAGVIGASFPGGEVVRVNLSDPFDLSLNASLSAADTSLTVHSVNTGVPHAVVVVEDIAAIDLSGLGAAIRQHEHFAPAGTNVNFMQVIELSRISVRTFERGVEGETLACGTGVVANAIVHHELTGAATPIAVTVHSGETLWVDFTVTDHQYSNVTLTGSADFVFEGEIDEPI
jgi:diaminopimelate epimerase